MSLVVRTRLRGRRPGGWKVRIPPDRTFSTGSARPLEDAFRIAHGDLIGWPADEHQMDKLDPYQLVTQISESPVANVCDPNYTFVAKARKAYLPDGETYGAARALEGDGAEYLRERGRT